MNIAESKRPVRTIALFFLAGVGSVGTLNLVSGGPFGRSSGLGSDILACPSVHFAAFMFLAFFAARKRGLLLGWTDPSARRAAVGSIGLALIWPTGLIVILLAGFLLLVSMNFVGLPHSESGDPTPRSFWQKRVDEMPLVGALLVGAVFTTFVAASAVQYIVGKRPSGFLPGLVVITIGVPILSFAVGGLLNQSNYVARLMAPVPPLLDFQLLLLIGQPVLGGVIGHWAHTAAQKRVVSPS